jgi:hypothetical protein
MAGEIGAGNHEIKLQMGTPYFDRDDTLRF